MIKQEQGLWLRCSKVSFSNETATWTLRSTPYDLFESYKEEPHRELINATSESDLKDFVAKWGPLRDRLPSTQAGTDPIARYQIVRNKLAWKADLLIALEKPEQRRSVLSRFDPLLKSNGELMRRSITDSSEVDRIIASRFLGSTDSYFSDPVKADTVILEGVRGFDVPLGAQDEWIPDWWIADATDQEIEDVCIRLAVNLEISHRPTYRFVRRQGIGELRAMFAFDGLVGALDWMLWQDVYHQRPFIRCDECEHLVPITTKHPKRFCSVACARKKTTREWQQLKREKARMANGTQKAR